MLLNFDFLQYTYFHNADKIDWILICDMRENSIIELQMIRFIKQKANISSDQENKIYFSHPMKSLFSNTIRIIDSRFLFVFCVNASSYQSHYFQSIFNGFFFDKTAGKLHFFNCKSFIAHNTKNQIVFSSIIRHMQNIYSDDDFSSRVR